MDLVQCALWDDYYQNECFVESDTGEYYVPREVFNKWEAAEAAWQEAQDEIGQFMKDLHRRPRPKPSITIWSPR